MDRSFYHILCAVGILQNCSSAIIETSNGYLEGTLRVSRSGSPFLAFLGIPYAQPPVGNLRFEPPQPAQNWSGVRDASSYGHWCMQPVLGSEDCLYLNVFTPLASNRPNKGPYPVLVFTHGGYYTTGSARLYGPDYILDEDVVYVNFNYRLHSLGFLNTGDGIIRGNMGLKDQVMALRWVQNNIEKFGGDPQKITIFGHSAGAASVSYLLLSPLTKGLFHRAISQSGTAIKVWSFQPKPAEQAKLLATRLDCPTSPSLAMVACLKRVGAARLTRMSALSSKPLKTDLEVFLPSIEVIEEGALISKHPYDILKAGEAHRVPWISGVNSGEGLLYTRPIRGDHCLVNEINSKWETLAPQFLYYDRARTDITDQITRFYFGNERINFNHQFDNFTQLWSDRLYISFSRYAGEIQAKYSPVYFYYFDYLKDFPREHVANHGEELFLFFPHLPHVGTISHHYSLSRKLIQLWVQFAASNNSTLEFDGFQWNPVSQQNISYMKISNDFNGIIPDPLKHRMDFWNHLNLYRVGPVDAGNSSHC